MFSGTNCHNNFNLNDKENVYLTPNHCPSWYGRLLGYQVRILQYTTVGRRTTQISLSGKLKLFVKDVIVVQSPAEISNRSASRFQRSVDDCTNLRIFRVAVYRLSSTIQFHDRKGLAEWQPDKRNHPCSGCFFTASIEHSAAATCGSLKFDTFISFL